MTGQPFQMLIPYFERRLSTLDFISATDTSRPRPPREEGSVNIRFDWELTPDQLEGNWPHLTEVPDEVQVGLIIPTLAYDLADICVNGDMDHHNDPMLKVMDGEHKLGERFKDFYISPALYYTEYKNGKDAVEWTIYMTIKGIKR